MSNSFTKVRYCFELSKLFLTHFSYTSIKPQSVVRLLRDLRAYFELFLVVFEDV